MTPRFYTHLTTGPRMLCGVLILAAACRAAEPAAARWEGTIEIPGAPMRIVIDLDRNSGGQWMGSAIIPGFGVKGAPLTGLTVDAANVAFTIKGALGEPGFKGHITPAGVLTGEFQQAGNTAPFTLEKAGEPQVDPPRQSTLIAKELEGVWQGSMDLLGNKVRVTLNLTSQAAGPAKAEFRFVGRRDTTLPFDLIIQDGDLLAIESEQTGLAYEGAFKKAVPEIAGTFRQGPLETPLVLRRAAK